MSIPSTQYFLKPLRTAATNLSDATIAAQNDFIGGAKHAREYLNAGLRQALSDVAKSNMQLQAAVADVAASARASVESTLERGHDLRVKANRSFFGLRKRAVSGASDAWDSSVQYSRDASQRLGKAAVGAKTWAAENPLLVFAAVATASYLAVLEYRRRRMARAAATEQLRRRRATSTAKHAANGAGVAKAKQRRTTHGAAAAK